MGDRGISLRTTTYSMPLVCLALSSSGSFLKADSLLHYPPYLLLRARRVRPSAYVRAPISRLHDKGKVACTCRGEIVLALYGDSTGSRHGSYAPMNNRWGRWTNAHSAEGLKASVFRKSFSAYARRRKQVAEHLCLATGSQTSTAFLRCFGSQIS